MKTKKSKTKRKKSTRKKAATDITVIGGKSIDSLRAAVAAIEAELLVPWTGAYCKHTETGVEIRFNNSGGRWWLDKADEKGLEQNGFRLEHDDNCGMHVRAAFIPNKNMRECLEAFRKGTKYTGTELGCNCCGTPFSFTAYVKGKEGDYYSPSYPAYGDDY